MPVSRLVRIALPAVAGLGVTGVGSGDGVIWVSESGQPHGHVLRLDVATRELRSSGPIGWAPSNPVSDGRDVWVSDTNGDGSAPTGDEGHVERIDATTLGVLAKVPVPDPNLIAVGAGAVWVGSGSGSGTRIVRIDSATDRVTANISIRSSVTYLSFAAGYLWAATEAPTGESLSRIDPFTLRAQSDPRITPAGPIQGDANRLWTVTLPENGRLTIAWFTPDPDAAPTLVPVAVDTTEWYIADGSLLVIRPAEIDRIDPVTGAIVGAPLALPIDPGNARVAVVDSGGVVYVVTNAAVTEAVP